MEKGTNYSIVSFITLCIIALNTFSQVTVSGYVRTMTGVPIEGATVTLVNLSLSCKTNTDGFYDFSTAPVINTVKKRDFSLTHHGNQLLLNLDSRAQVSVTLFNLSGKLIGTPLNKPLIKGRHQVTLRAAGRANQQLYLLRVTIGEKTAFYKMTVFHGVVASLSPAGSTGVGNPMVMTASRNAEDSMVVTHPQYCGGNASINTRRISETTGTQNFRMFSTDTSDTGWWASEMQFDFTPHHAGVDYYKEKVPDYVPVERWTQMEIQQSIWRYPSEIPSNKKWATYKCNINANVSTSVASTGGNTLNFNPRYINRKSRWEIIGVQHHEMVHSYHPFYNINGSNGFGEAMCDAIRCLTGYFYWPKGTKCRGGYQQAYQGGGKYWYFIELKHPGFFYEIYKRSSSTNIKTAVREITGESLDDLCDECESGGMPYTLGRGRF